MALFRWTTFEKQKRENMNEKELAPHITDIDRALKGKVSSEEIEEELRKFSDEYRISLGDAKRAVVKKFGGDPSELYLNPEKKINEIRGDERNLDLKARIVTIQDKEIELEGKPKTIFYGIFGDDTGTVPFTIWDSKSIDLEKGDTVHVKKAYANTWNDQPQVNIGTMAGIGIVDDDEVPAFERDPQLCGIKDIRTGMRNLIVIGRIMTIEKRVVNTDNGEKDIFSGVLADESGKIQFTSWHDFGLESGQPIKITGGYVREWRGIPQLNFDDTADLEFLDDEDVPSVDKLSDSSTITISQLARRGGAVDAIVDAVVIDIKTGSGLIFRCPECNRVVQKGACRIHGKVEGEADLRVKGILDDGTGALTIIMNCDLTEDILGYGIDKAKELARDRMDQDVIKDELEELMIAQPVRVRGNVTSDEYGLMLVATDIDFKKIDVEEEARRLLDEVSV